MNPQFLIAKLAANASDTAWSQAYSTLNFYVVLSVTTNQPTEKPLAQIGKETLERLQREYFSLDEKTLESIKQAVESTIDSSEKDITYSLILATNNADTLYIITAGLGTVAIKRGEKLGIIAKGSENEVLSFSGPLHHHDLVVIQTADFAAKIPMATLAASLDSFNVTEISENIAPDLHSNSSGGEAAIVLLYTNPEVQAQASEEDSEKEMLSENESENNHEEDTSISHLSAPLFEDEPKVEKSRRKVTIPSPSYLIASLRTNRKKLIGLAIVILLVGLVGSILFQTRQQESAQNGEAISKAVTLAQAEYEEGVALEPLNRPLALEKYTQSQKILIDTKNAYPNDSEIDQVTTLLTKVDQKLSEFSSGTKVDNGTEVAGASDLKLDEIHTVSMKGGTLFVTDKANTLVTLTSDGEVEDTYEIDASTIIGVSANSESAYVLTNNDVRQVDLSSGDDEQLFEIDAARQALDIFGSNVYLTSVQEKMVEKYAPSSYSKSDYLTDALPANPVSLAIDGSIYVLMDNGKIGKFTRGADDGFNVTGLQGGIGKKSILYTEEDFTNLYVLDSSNQRLLVVAKNGEVKQEFSWEIFKNATDFAVNESDKLVYIATSTGLYTFTF